jgi:hypothetical protein
MTNGAYGGDDGRDRIREAVYDTLLDKIRGDRFPSATMMNMFEQGMDERQRAEYADVLMERVRDDRFPSIDMLKRLISLT